MDDESFRKMLADIDARQEAMDRLMAQANVVEALGVVEEVVGFSDSLAIKLRPWRWGDGPLEQGGLYVRKRKPAEGELRTIRNALSDFPVIRLRVRPDVSRRGANNGMELWDALLEAIVENPAADPELEAMAKQHRETTPPAELGKPKFDFWWSAFEFLARFLPAPALPVVQIGAPLPEGNWWPEKEAFIFEGCEEWFCNSDSGTVRAGVLNGVVQGVLYDLAVYRRSGLHRMRKLQSLLAAHSDKGEKLQRIVDNQFGAMIYRTLSGARFAIYAYNVDWFTVHSRATTYRAR